MTEDRHEDGGARKQTDALTPRGALKIRGCNSAGAMKESLRRGLSEPLTPREEGWQ